MYCPECSTQTKSTTKPKVKTWTFEECEVCNKIWVKYTTDKIVIYEMPIVEAEASEDTDE